MDKKEYLKQIRGIDGIVEAYRERVMRLRSAAERCTPHYGVKVREARRDRYDHADKLALAEREYGERTGDLLALREAVERSIQAVRNRRHRQILELRYVRHMSWREIGGTLFYSRKWLWQLHERALAELVIPETYAAQKAAARERMRGMHSPPGRLAEAFFEDDGGERPRADRNQLPGHFIKM